MKTKITFVILHYLNVKDTIQCIESILSNIKYDNYNIIVVDNGSPNYTGKKLYDKYEKEDKVYVLLSKENLGFANGNNLGYLYAKKNYGSDFIILINNDTIIEQKDFCNKIISIYNSSSFDILGPKIKSLVDGYNPNPVPYVFKTKLKVIKRILSYSLKYIILFLPVIKKFSFEKKYHFHKNIPEEYQLHGCCLIFSKNYIKRFNGLCNRTYMYCEEDFLKYYAIKYNLKMMYSEDIIIYHKEGSATKSLNNSSIKSMRFFYKYNIVSLIELLKTMIFNLEI